jgi:lipopolysaccharide transport system permease protein
MPIIGRPAAQASHGDGETDGEPLQQRGVTTRIGRLSRTFAGTLGGELVTRRDLFLNMTRAELTARYKTTGLGFLWFIVTPIILMGVLTIVFSRVINLGVDNYPLFVLSALLPWTFFQMAVLSATTSVSHAVTLVKRVRMPRVFLPLSTIAASFVNFIISVGLFVVLAFVLGHAPGLKLLLLAPLIVVNMACVVGLGLFLASLQVRYRDVEFLVQAGLRVLFYLTPLFYPLRLVPEAWHVVYLMNPMAGTIELYRAILLPNLDIDPLVVVMATLSSAICLVIGVIAFRRAEPDFDDHI